MKKMLSLVMVLAMTLTLAACGGSSAPAATAAPAPAATEAPAAAETAAAPAADVPAGLEDGVLTIAMECAYAPYNWTQSDDSNGAVPIANVPGSYANGYDVMIGKKIAEANGWELEVIQSDWDSLVPGVQTGTFDAVIAGQSMTAERAEQVDFAGPYFYATIVCVTKADGKFADATSIADLAGGSCTAQIATIWYDQCLPQIQDANIQTAAEKTGASPAKALLLQHMVLSHHGIPDYGSPIAPKFPEAEVLNTLDTLDARLYEMDEAIARAVPGGFSEKVWGLDNRQLYRIPEGDLT